MLTSFPQTLRLDLLTEQAPDLVWPSPAAVLRARERTGLPDQVKAHVRHLWSRPLQRRFISELQRHASWARLFATDLRYFHTLQSHFLDRRRNLRQRLEATLVDLDIAARRFGKPLCDRIAAGEQVTICPLPGDSRLCIGLNDLSSHEGLWAISVRNAAGQRLYYATFSFLDERAVLVATMQGPCASAGSKALIKDLTKAAHGLRPPALLLSCLRVLCEQWQIESMYGIAPHNHVKGGWNIRRKRLRFDYQALWAEHRGALAANGHWQLPLAVLPRDPDSIPSQKRAMYRRRQGLLADMKKALAQMC